MIPGLCAGTYRKTGNAVKSDPDMTGLPHEDLHSDGEGRQGDYAKHGQYRALGALIQSWRSGKTEI